MPTDERVVVSLGAVARAFQGPPRLSQQHCCTPIIGGNIGPPRTPKCYSRQCWALESINSFSDTLVRGRERRTKRESSLVLGAADISWTMISQLALTARRQLTKNRFPDSTYVKLTTCFPLGAGTDVFWNLLRRFLEFLRETSREK